MSPFRRCCRSFFFFSSRRRHTRYIGDWSSDVCSSDLITAIGLQHRIGFVLSVPIAVIVGRGQLWTYMFARSEERRVGKECRYRWGRDAVKNKVVRVVRRREGEEERTGSGGPKHGGIGD